jgi:hypothetical protein
MRKRGPIAVLLSVAAFLFWEHLDKVYREGPFGSEYGSMAAPPPPLAQTVGWLTIFLALGALGLCLIDFVRWAKRRAHVQSR